ncbi:MAG: short-chain dehydrogenase [Thermodesulfobacteriota bacterium]|nr:MAG: short-chain dehydrogenase [Thermodesulfobacteriota bacterium]
MKSLKEAYGDWALITGASSGIGEVFCRKLAAAGMNVVLVARRKDRLDKIAKELNDEHSIHTRVVCADLSDEEETKTVVGAVDDLEIGLLVNNAGILNTGNFLDNDLEDEIRLININCKSYIILTHGLGNKMKERNKGALIFLSSLTAVSAISRWANYAASKGFDLQFAEAIDAELKDYNIDVMALCPGLTHTELVKISKFNNPMTMNADVVVDNALNKLGKTNLLVPGLMNKINFFSTRINPRLLNTKIFSSVVKSTQESNLK